MKESANKNTVTSITRTTSITKFHFFRAKRSRLTIRANWSGFPSYRFQMTNTFSLTVKGITKLHQIHNSQILDTNIKSKNVIYLRMPLSRNSPLPTGRKSIKSSNHQLLKSTVTTTYNVESYFLNRSTRHQK